MLVLRMSGFFAEDLDDLFQQDRTSILSSAPHHIPIDPKVSVHENVTKGYDLSPRHLMVLGLQLPRKTRRGFTDESL